MSASSARLEELVRTAVRAELDDLRRFVDRRIAELSMEIHATVQLVDFSETNLSARLAGIHDQIADLIEDWFHDSAADGFNLMPPILPAMLEVFIDEVVPLLQRRGLLRTAYAGQTLRAHYGLPRPDVRFL